MKIPLAKAQLKIQSDNTLLGQGEGVHKTNMRLFQQIRTRATLCLLDESDLDIEQQEGALTFLDTLLHKIAIVSGCIDLYGDIGRRPIRTIQNRVLSEIEKAGLSEVIIVNRKKKNSKPDWERTTLNLQGLYNDIFYELFELDESCDCILLLQQISHLGRNFRMTIPEVLQKQD